ncbi:MAG: hypothetical protein IPK00_17270 [Deltaproteobacteria bacterium]|nr:hypothetical protein [Deltaproteobacteria bacterium]
MTPFSWHDAYYSELQNLYSLLVVPLAFLAYRLASPADAARAVVPGAARFVARASLVFAALTMLDPIATGPLVASESLRGTAAATLVPFFFVYLGDLRVLLVAFAVARPELPFASTLARAAAATAIVPVGTGILYATLRAFAPEAHGQWLWMIYEAGFLLLCVVAVRRGLSRAGVTGPGRAFLEALFGYSAAYYALWLAADVLIVGAELDLGWAIRMVPNQLYYAFWVPFVSFRFFSATDAKAPR